MGVAKLHGGGLKIGFKVVEELGLAFDGANALWPKHVG
jgi:hypothetical protein